MYIFILPQKLFFQILFWHEFPFISNNDSITFFLRERNQNFRINEHSASCQQFMKNKKKLKKNKVYIIGGMREI